MLNPVGVTGLLLRSVKVGVGTVMANELKVFWLYSSSATQKALENTACVAPVPAFFIASLTSSSPKEFLFIKSVTVPSGSTQALSALLQ